MVNPRQGSVADCFLAVFVVNYGGFCVYPPYELGVFVVSDVIYGSFSCTSGVWDSGTIVCPR